VLQSFLQGILDQHKKMQLKGSSSSSVSISLTISEMVPKSIMTDERRLYQIVDNLLINARKFTKGGSITLECTVDRCSLLIVPRAGVSRWSARWTGTVY
jgi:signal transduction histidine kinase